MKQDLQMAIGWIYPIVMIIIIFITNTRKNLKGKSWLNVFLIGTFALMLTWRIPGLMIRFDLVEVSMVSTFFNNFNIPLNLLNILFLCFLFPYVLAISKPDLDQDKNQTLHISQTKITESSTDQIETWGPKSYKKPK